MRQLVMADSSQPPRRRGAVALSALVGKVLDPVVAARGFATADLIAAWPEIVGARFADCTAPEKIVWSRGDSNAGRPGTLVLRVDGPRAVLVQHETDQIRERVNGFLGYAAIAQVRLVQAPVARREKPETPSDGALSPAQQRVLSEAVSRVADDRLRGALTRLGRAVMGKDAG